MMKRTRPASVWVASLVAAAACSTSGAERPVHTASDAQGGGDMQITSTAFDHEGTIPRQYTCDGSDVSPPLSIAEVPVQAQSLALVVDDPDAPAGTWDHWVAYDIPVMSDIAEDVGSLGTGGNNSWGRAGYGGPCPPGGTHRYFFTVYALDARLDLAAGASKGDVLAAIEGHVVAEATLMGRYSR